VASIMSCKFQVGREAAPASGNHANWTPPDPGVTLRLGETSADDRQAYVTVLDMPTGGDGLRVKPGLRRRFALSLSWMALLIVVGGTILWAQHVWTSLNVSDVFSLATLVITFLAAAVAFLAYQVATGLPDLTLYIWFKDEEPGSRNIHIKTSVKRWAELGNWFDAKDDYPIPKLKEDDDGSAKVAYMSIYNASRYSARNPAVIFRFGGVNKPTLGLCKSWETKDDLPWKDISLTNSGTFVVETQWDGGYPIHGRSGRRLPDLPLDALYSTNPDKRSANFEVYLLADGYRQTQPITIKFIVEPSPDTDAPVKRHSRWWPCASRPR